MASAVAWLLVLQESCDAIHLIRADTTRFDDSSELKKAS